MSKIFLFQVQLEHGSGHKEAGPWEVNIEQASTKCEEAETIMIVATVTGEGSRIQKFSFHVLCTAGQTEAIFLQYCCQFWYRQHSRVSFRIYL
jgi:hypothetical protein